MPLNHPCKSSTIIFQLGETIQVWFQSELDKVNSILEKNANPFSFLCQALNLKASDPKANEAVDK